MRSNPDIVALYCAGASIPDVAALSNLPRSTVYFRLKKAGVLRTRTEGVRAAAAKGRLGSGMRGKKRQFSSQHKSAIRAAAVARGERDAKGISKKPNGYVEITRGPNKGRTVHRVRAERLLGRKLTADEVVHHRNEVRDDNRRHNLQVMTRAEHTALHTTGV